MPNLLLPLLAAAAPAVDQAPASDPISFQTALLVIIAGALLFLAKNVASVNRRLTDVETTSPFSTPQSAGATPVQPVVPEGPAPEIIAAITAAIHTTLRSRHRILSVGQPCPNRQAWSLEGRRQVFQSHKIR